MTIREFSDGFDTLLNSFRQQHMFGDQAGPQDIVLDEYEKSFFLTKAQEEEVLSLYTGRNSSLQSFEETEELRRYLSNLVSEATKTPITTSGGAPLGINSNSKFFTLPEDLWFITYEDVKITGETCDHSNSMQVVPATQDEYHRLKKNPFRGANFRRALRFDLADGVVEIVSKYTISEYYIRYIKKLPPIQLVDTEDENRVLNEDESPCILHEALHQRILERAVGLALRSKGITAETQSQHT